MMTCKLFCETPTSGFRTGYSTSLAESNICDEIVNHLDNHKITYAILLDLAKAYDTVDQSVLLQKLYMYGDRGIAFHFFKLIFVTENTTLL